MFQKKGKGKKKDKSINPLDVFKQDKSENGEKNNNKNNSKGDNSKNNNKNNNKDNKDNKDSKDNKNKKKNKPKIEKKEQGTEQNRITSASKKKNNPGESIRIIPLGGLEQIGMNITAFETESSIIVVDCGLAFPEDDMLGVDLVIPDITYLEERKDKVKGFVITHGHEDHIGALPYVLQRLCVPIYATRLTMAIIENKLKEHNLLGNVKRKVINYGQFINLGDFRIEFICTNHSIADSAALAIYTPAGVIVHTGDFKVDYTPVYGDTIDLARFGELGKKGVLALMCDSTNVLKPGFTESERTVGKTFDTIFEDNSSSRIIVATFASNVDRVQQIINSAKKQMRKDLMLIR